MPAINLSLEQETAVAMCADLSIRIACVTGQAGSGKTTILKEAALRVMEELFGENFDVAALKDSQAELVKLVAPTGRAAKRIEEATGIPAMTIHRMMRFSMPEDDKDFGLPAYTKTNKMPHTVVFVDEASMLTHDIRRQLIDALPSGAVIRFFGDINQLPPIGSLSPFAEDLQKFPSITLTKNFRSEDGIISVADAVIRNRMPVANSQVVITRCAVVDTSNTVMQLAKTLDFTATQNQIICPTKTTTHGCERLNTLIQQRFNPEQEKISVYQRDRDGSLITRSFKRGDKIIWDKNDYNMDLMNGTIGKVQAFDIETGTIVINCDGRDFTIPSKQETFNPLTGERKSYDPRHHMLLAYAITTHKSQGSQFDVVCYVVSRSRAATRQNVYTGITRAKHKVIIINAGGALTHAIANKTALE